MALAASVLVVPGLPARPAAAAERNAATCPASATDRATARATAVRCRQQVEDESARGEKEQVYANADGTMTSVLSARVQRVRRGGKWVAPDAAVRRVRDRLVPVAAAMDMSFSAGGKSPLVTVRAGGGEVALRWPHKLPAPTVSGSRVTYPSVFPDVDLVLTADVEGFSKVLVVKTAAAAANPALDEVRFAVEANGLGLRAGDGGSMRVVDAAGAPVLASGTPAMWDSSGSGPERRSSDAVGAGEGARNAAMAVGLSGADVVIRPDRAFLAAATTRFPVYIDPSLVASAWTMINNRFPNQSYWSYDKFDCPTGYPSSLQCAKVGFTDDPSPSMVYRSAFQFPAGDYVGKHVLDAKFSIDLLHSWICDATRTDIHVVNTGLHSGTTWNNNAGAWVSTPAAVGWNSTCGKARKRAEWGLTGTAQTAAAQSWGSTTFGLRAFNEGNHNAWKKFDATTARFVVTYNSFPNAPDQLTVNGSGCVTGAGRPYVRTTTPELRARLSDPDGLARSLTGTFSWWPVGGAPNGTDTVSQGNVASGTQAVVGIPAGRLADGGTYAVRAAANDGVDSGQFSATCEFTVDVTPPAAPSAVVSATYPSNGQLHGGAGIGGSFTFSPPASNPADVVGYAYTLDTGLQAAQAQQVTAAADHGAQVQLTPSTDGVQTLRVWSRDVAGNFSASPQAYTFGVRAGAGPDAVWRLDEPDGSSATDSSRHGNALTLVNPARTPGRGGAGNALVLDGTGAHGRTAGPLTTRDPDTDQPTPVRTDANFTVSAWVRLDATGTGQRTVVSQEGARTSAFHVGYSGADNRWRFAMAGSDVDAPTVSAVLSDAAPVVGRWTHLTAVYDAASDLMRLYVDGTLQAQVVTAVGGFNATGPVVVGRRLWAANPDGWFAGAVDDVRVYRRTLNPAENEFANALKPVTPRVTFPEGNRGYTGRPLRVEFDANGDTAITAIRYSYAGIGLENTVTLPAPGGRATVTITPATPGETFVSAAGVTAGGRQSDRADGPVRILEPPAVEGTVVDGWTGAPVSGAVVRLLPPGTTVTTGADGSYSFTGLEAGEYTVTAAGSGVCGQFASTRIAIETRTSVGLMLMSQSDRFGYTCSAENRTFVPAEGTVYGSVPTDPVTLPFEFAYYGSFATKVWLSDQGFISFTGDITGSSEPATIPSNDRPNGIAAPYWASIVVDDQASVRTASAGVTPNRTFTVEWRNVALAADPTKRVTFEVVLQENGRIVFNYADLDDDVERGAEAIIGLESRGGSSGLQYSHHDPVLANGRAVVFRYPTTPNLLADAGITGIVRRDGAAVNRGSVWLQPAGTRAGLTADGTFFFDGVEEGSYTVYAHSGCDEGTAVVDLGPDGADATVDLAPASSTFGHTCAVSTQPFVRGTTRGGVPSLLGQTEITLPFAFPYFGYSNTTVFATASGLRLAPIPNPGKPYVSTVSVYNPLVYADAQSRFWTAVTGTAPNRQFVIEWRNMVFVSSSTNRVSYEVILSEDGTITLNYADVLASSAAERGPYTVGIAGPGGDRLQYSTQNTGEPDLANDRAITFTPHG